MNTLGAGGFVYVDLVVLVAACNVYAVTTLYRDKTERAVRRSVSEFGIMFEYDEFADSHFSSCSRVIVLKHVDDSGPQQLKVVLAEMCYTACEIGGNKAVGAVKSVWNDVLAPHFGVLFS